MTVREKLSERAAGAWLILRESARSFGRNRGLESAATLAFYGLLAMMPLLLLLFFSLGRLAGSSELARQVISELVAEAFPMFDRNILDELARLAEQRAWGVMGIFALLWSLTPFAASARHAVADVFKSDRRPPFWREKLLDLTAALALMLLLIAAGGGKLLGWPPAIDHPVLRAVQALTAYAIAIAVIGLFYLAFSPVPLRWGEAAAGAVAALALLAAMRPAFVALLTFNPRYGYAFGSLKALFVAIVWAHYAFAALLFGAEFAANTRRREALLLRAYLGAGPANAARARRLLERFIRRPDAGTILFREGDSGSEMFFVRTGAVRLSQGGVELTVMRPGDYFGEMSMLLGAPRTATAEVVEPGTELIVISAHNFEAILAENPQAVRKLLTDMAARLQATNRRLTG